MTPLMHATELGKLVSNFHSLETLLRVVLLKHSRTPDQHATLKFAGLQEGVELSVNELTDYSDLRTLIKRFNKHARQVSKPELDLALVDLRDALAHGRVVGDQQTYPLRLIKFSRQDTETKKVKLVVNQVLTLQWFHRQIARTHAAIQQVAAEA